MNSFESCSSIQTNDDNEPRETPYDRSHPPKKPRIARSRQTGRLAIPLPIWRILFYVHAVLPNMPTLTWREKAEGFIAKPFVITINPALVDPLIDQCPTTSSRRLRRALFYDQHPLWARGDSFPTGTVQVSRFLGAQLLENILDLFESPPQAAQAACSRHHVKLQTSIRCGHGETRTPKDCSIRF